MPRLQFKVEAEASGSRARATTFTTLHNTITTPLFMPVGTQATVRSQTPDALEAAGAQMLLANTYHLMQRPGPEVFRRLGGIHGLASWNRSILTDSGGFQIFSLAHAREMSEEGAKFRSHIDGKPVFLSPELSIEMQIAIGSDIMMVLDECVPSTCSESRAREAMELTHRWAKRSLAARGDSPQSIFAIVQGASFPHLRAESASALTELPFDGFAVGGLAVGETKSVREDITELTAAKLPRDLPRYLMGVGTPLDLLEAVHRGMDLFDCIIPTAMAQQGLAYTSKGRVDLRRGSYRFAEAPLDPECRCPTCARYSRAYLFHLTKVQEFLGWQLIGTHNIHFYLDLCRSMREAILKDTFSHFYREKREKLGIIDEDNPAVGPKRNHPKEKSRREGNYEIIVNELGKGSVRHVSGEIMHSVNDPETEAKRLYVEQSRFRELLLGGEDRPLVVWDVGLGAATNAMSAIHAYEEVAKKTSSRLREVSIVSFENDLDALRLALRHVEFFPHLFHAAPRELVESQSWKSKFGPLHWQLIEGNFLETLESAPTPDLIFFDPFSYKTDSFLWTHRCFRKVLARCRPHESYLFTYSGSTAVRATLLASGFYVARGLSSGPKSETTIALTVGAAKSNRHFTLLDRDWLSRWERSTAKYPNFLPMEEYEGFEKVIRSHPQFQSSTTGSNPS